MDKIEHRSSDQSVSWAGKDLVCATEGFINIVKSSQGKLIVWVIVTLSASCVISSQLPHYFWPLQLLKVIHMQS